MPLSSEIDRHLMELTLPFSKFKDLLFAFKRGASFIIFPDFQKSIPETVIIQDIYMENVLEKDLIIPTNAWGGLEGGLEGGLDGRNNTADREREAVRQIVIIAKHPSFPIVPEGGKIPRKEICFSATKVSCRQW